ncbi:MAG: hypothetical protein GXP18_03645 [Gammaproteobacteria bacterium]|nr:hypothetical protein [Gammaproteobacteria bacterium]
MLAPIGVKRHGFIKWRRRKIGCNTDVGQLIQYITLRGPVFQPLQVIMKTAAHFIPAPINNGPTTLFDDAQSRNQSCESGTDDLNRGIRMIVFLLTNHGCFSTVIIIFT